MWQLVLALVGVVVVVVAVIFGIGAGEVDRVLNDPKLREEHERRRAWRKKIGGKERRG